MLRLVGGRFSLIVLVHDLWRLFAMNPHVLLEVSTLAEAFATDIADVGTFAGVQSGVNHHFVSLSEGFVTKLTCVGSSV